MFLDCAAPRLTTRTASYRSLGPEIPESLKTVFPGLLAQSVKQVSKNSQKYGKYVKISVQGLSRHFFDTPGVLFETL